LVYPLSFCPLAENDKVILRHAYHQRIINYIGIFKAIREVYMIRYWLKGLLVVIFKCELRAK